MSTLCVKMSFSLRLLMICYFGSQRWVIEVIGAPGTLYANETYKLQVDFPEHYPMEAPQVCNKPLD